MSRRVVLVWVLLLVGVVGAMPVSGESLSPVSGDRGAEADGGSWSRDLSGLAAQVLGEGPRELSAREQELAEEYRKASAVDADLEQGPGADEVAELVGPTGERPVVRAVSERVRVADVTVPLTEGDEVERAPVPEASEVGQDPVEPAFPEDEVAEAGDEATNERIVEEATEDEADEADEASVGESGSEVGVRLEGVGRRQVGDAPVWLELSDGELWESGGDDVGVVEVGVGGWVLVEGALDGSGGGVVEIDSQGVVAMDDSAGDERVLDDVVPVSEVSVEVLDSEGAAGFGSVVAFRVSSADVGSGGLAGVVRVAVDVAGWARFESQDWLGRLELVRFPACYSVDASRAGCAAEVVGSAVVDAEAGVLWADVVVDAEVPVGGFGRGGLVRASGSGGSTYGASAGYISQWGSWAATPLLSSSMWSVGLSGGEFSWSYPVAVTDTAFGAAPAVALGYSSQAVDGLVPDENAQGAALGPGWMLSVGGFIERQYATCTNDGGSIHDLCWRSHNAFLSVGGVSGELVATDSTFRRWRLQDDPGWRVTRNTGLAGSPDAGSSGDTGEHWLVESPDGVRYEFGYVPSSVLVVPVWGNTAGEPCHDWSPKVCHQAWRWMLNRVVDPNGNEMVFEWVKESNKYGLGGNPSWATSYDRGAYLDKVYYGRKTGPTPQWRHRIVFVHRDRCMMNGSATCMWSGSSTQYWPDVPTDLECSGTYCTKYAPSFFTKKVLSEIVTEVNLGWGSSDDWRWINEVSLLLEWPDPDGPGPDPAQLWLREIRRRSKAAAMASVPVSVPAIRFEAKHSYLDNRGDAISTKRWRVDRIDDEIGGRTEVWYGQPRGCATSVPSPSWAANTTHCYPRWVTHNGYSGWAILRKYVVTRVDRYDLVAGGVPVETRYTYSDAPKWQKEESEFVPTNLQTYSRWRGHSHVHVASGTPGTTQSLSLHVFYRGMHQQTGHGTVNVVDTQLSGGPDYKWLYGRVREVTELNATSQAVVSRTAYDYYSPAPTATHSTTTEARVTVVIKEHRWQRNFENNFSKREIWTSWDMPDNGVVANNAYSRLKVVWDRGDLANSSDDTCTVIEYATPSASWRVLDRPRHVQTTQGIGIGGQGSQGSCSGAEISRSFVRYDGNSSSSQSISKGNVTAEISWVSSTEGDEVVTTYTRDSTTGLVTAVNGPRTDVSDVTSFEHHAFFGYVVAQTMPNGHKVSFTREPGLGVLYEVRDHNTNVLSSADDRVTTATFDGLGRYLEIRKPTEQGTTWPSIRYSYHVSKTEPSWVQTELLQSSAGVWLRSRSYVDGLGRERETQTPSPGGGRIVTAAVYDSRNLVTRQTAPYFNSGSFGANMATAAGVPTSGITETRFVYDDLARVTARQHFHNNTFRWETGYVHSWPFHVEIPPVGAAVWNEADMMGRTRARHLFTQGWNAETISYTYTARGELSRVDDPAGNRTSYTYNYLGWPVEVREPNTGTVNYSYDRAGNVTSEQRPTSTLWHSYDSVNRPLQTRVGDATGQLLVRHWWDDTGEMGLLHRRRTWTPNPTDANAPWWRLEFDVTGYDARGRALGHSWVIPPEVPGLAGTYTAEFGYDAADHLITTTYPAMGDLPVEALVTFYSPEGNPRQMLTTLPTFAWVVSDTTWDNVGRVTTRTTPAGVRSYGYDVVSGRLSNQSFTTQATGVVVQNDSYVWDAGGNLTTITSNPANTAFRERQCFGYDTWNRLTWARTTSTTTTCSPSANHQHGPGPYAHSYSYNAINNLTSGPAGTYSYPTPGLGVSRPHAPTSINGVGHSWNAAGQLTTRTGQWSATYTPQGQTATITAGTQRTVYAYGPDAERVLTHTVNTATNTLTASTLTLGNLGELTIDHATGITQATRFLTMAGTTVAVRANDGTLTWPLGNHQGSIVATVTTAGATQRHLYTPYGAARTTPPATTATRGFLNQPHNTTHQLSHLHHRHYDPHSGIFTTVDPLVTATGTPYLYANANPATFADPTGLMSADSAEKWVTNGYSCSGSGLLIDCQGPTGSTGSSASTAPQTHLPPTCDRFCSAMSEPGSREPQTSWIYRDRFSFETFAEYEITQCAFFECDVLLLFESVGLLGVGGVRVFAPLYSEEAQMAVQWGAFGIAAFPGAPHVVLHQRQDHWDEQTARNLPVTGDPVRDLLYFSQRQYVLDPPPTIVKFEAAQTTTSPRFYVVSIWTSVGKPAAVTTRDQWVTTVSPG